MTSPLLALALLLADPTPQQIELLTTFKSEFVLITPGRGKFRPTFRLGDDRKAEMQHSFYIAKYEVPQNLWEAVMGSNPSRWKGPRNSVEMLSLDESKEFCTRATQLMRAAGLIEAGQVVRLPTEAEWEYAARAGTASKFSFGDDESRLGEYGWFTGNAKGNDPPVGAKKPNPWGLFDVHGYLWEWTDSPAAGDTAMGVLRGGSWKDPAADLASSNRRVVERTLRDDAVGLRCVLTVAQASGRREPPDTAAALTAQPLRTEFAPPAQEKIVPAGAKLEMLFGEGEFTEGPALAPDGSILFSDIGQSIYRYDPKTGKTDLFRRPSGRTNGLMFNQRGELVACEGANTGGNRRISITTGIDGAKDGSVRTLADRFEGKRFNSPNDLAIDAGGRVYFTDPRYVGDEPRELDFEAVFLVSTDGSVKVATREVSKPNGILVSPDGKTVYVSDNNPQGNRHLTAFAVAADGTLNGKRVLHDFGTGRGVDGMTLDTAGTSFAAAGSGDRAGIYVFAPDGAPLARIPTPGDPTNCVFGGGSDSSTLYVTCANGRQREMKYGLYRIKLNATGHHVVKLK
jgi:gluconolactonase